MRRILGAARLGEAETGVTLGEGAPRRFRREAATRLAWRMTGWGLFLFGLIGVFLPLWPTTICWILAVLALGRADPELTERIRTWPKFGPMIADFVDYGVLAPVGKAAALCAICGWAVALPFLFELTPPLALAIFGLALAAAYVATRPTRRRD